MQSHRCTGLILSWTTKMLKQVIAQKYNVYIVHKEMLTLDLQHILHTKMLLW